MKFDTIENKSSDGLKVNLLSNIITTSENVVVRDYIRIDEMCEMLPTILSYVSYGTVNYADKILKFNRISNAFGIIRGMIIAIPELNSYDNERNIVNVAQIKNQKKKITNLSDVLSTIKSSQSSSTFVPSKKLSSGKSFTKTSDGILKF